MKKLTNMERIGQKMHKERDRIDATIKAEKERLNKMRQEESKKLKARMRGK